MKNFDHKRFDRPPAANQSCIWLHRSGITSHPVLGLHSHVYIVIHKKYIKSLKRIAKKSGATLISTAHLWSIRHFSYLILLAITHHIERLTLINELRTFATAEDSE